MRGRWPLILSYADLKRTLRSNLTFWSERKRTVEDMASSFCVQIPWAAARRLSCCV